MTTAPLRPSVTDRRPAQDDPPAPWRVWVREWLFAHRAVGDDAEAAARRWAHEQYAGRLQPDEVQYRVDDEGGVHSAVVMARLWNVRAEWKHRHQAEGYVEVEGYGVFEAEIAQVGSREERHLRAYGQLMLPSTVARPWEDPT